MQKCTKLQHGNKGQPNASKIINYIKYRLEEKLKINRKACLKNYTCNNPRGYYSKVEENKSAKHVNSIKL